MKFNAVKFSVILNHSRWFWKGIVCLFRLVRPSFSYIFGSFYGFFDVYRVSVEFMNFKFRYNTLLRKNRQKNISIRHLFTACKTCLSKSCQLHIKSWHENKNQSISSILYFIKIAPWKYCKDNWVVDISQKAFFYDFMSIELTCLFFMVDFPLCKSCNLPPPLPPQTAESTFNGAINGRES